MAEIEHTVELARTVGRLDVLSRMTIRYTHDHGEPNPSPGIPYEAVLDYKVYKELIDAAREKVPKK
jgi:hypothetical protein